MLNIKLNWLRARIYHNLKSLIIKGDKLDSRTLEIELAHALGMEHHGDKNHHADAVGGNVAVSIKTIGLSPVINKTVERSRDFHTHPDKFFGPKYAKKHDTWTNGIEVVQRRQALKEIDDVNAPADVVGRATIDGFKESQEASHLNYGTNQTYEAVWVHGYNRTKDEYISTIYFDEYKQLNPDTMDWRRTISGVDGYQFIDGKMMKVMTRLNGNVPRHATCFKEYKNLTEYNKMVTFAVPMPKPHVFDEEALTSEIDEYYSKKDINSNKE
jgi:hypothetical protein